jgi:hypothetical protein
MRNILIAIILLILFSFLGCKSREEGGGVITDGEEGELTMELSTRPQDPFATDSVEVKINGFSGQNQWIFQLSAFESQDGDINEFGFTVFGISLPGEKLVDSSGISGMARFYDGQNDKEFLSLSSSGQGSVIVSSYDAPGQKITGSFVFTLVDTLTGDLLIITDGCFDTNVDSLY